LSYFHEKQFLLEENLLPPDERCVICGGTDRTRVLCVQRTPDVWLLRCRNCHVCSTSRMPTEETLEALYTKYYSNSTHDYTETQKCTFDKPHKLAGHIAQHVPKREPRDRPIHVLDFGGGDGTISQILGRALATEGKCEVQITLIDTSNEAQVESEGIPISVRSSLDEDDRDKYDIVIASAILEHIPYPVEIFRSLLMSMTSSGVFYARTPYVVPLARLLPIPAIRSTLFAYPFHVHDMGQAFWESALKTMNMPACFRLSKSQPSVVERTLKQDFLRTIAAHSLKAGWYLFGRAYGLVGGWEVFIQKSGVPPHVKTDVEL
jgi:2-polyprenyl-3-methyl-5-hydroxy-6-metoxy-1,4-benzoquinol methylase